jgi:hypothetical protein
MAKQTLNTLKQFFKIALKPTQQQFWDWLDSFWHKDDKIPLQSLDGLQDELDKKADKTTLDDAYAAKNHSHQGMMIDTDYSGENATKTVNEATKATNDGNGNNIATTYATKSNLNEKVDKADGYGLSQENFTSDEKAKLAGMDGNHWKGKHLSFESLVAAWPLAIDGDYAAVDAGVGEDIASYLWDSTDNKWVLQKGVGTSETAASVKSKYESNPDTNAFTDILKAKLVAFTENFTSELKTAYDSSVTWITNHGTDIINHLADGVKHITSGERITWNAKWDSNSHPTTVAGYGITDIPTNADTVDGFHVWSGSQAAYDAIVTKSSTTIYIIV